MSISEPTVSDAAALAELSEVTGDRFREVLPPFLRVVEPLDGVEVVHPPAATAEALAEARTEWSRARSRAVFLFALCLAAVVVVPVTFELWTHTSAPRTRLEHGLVWGSYLWPLLAIPAVLNVIGVLLGRARPGDRADASAASPISNQVSFRIVTRGDHDHSVRETIAAVEREMERLPVFPYVIEVVTDQRLELEPDEHVLQHVVDPDYRTPCGARFKARALQYALDVSPVAETTWIVHLDEETQVTASAILGIRRAVEEEERSGLLRIGQGALVYDRDFEDHPVLTMADSIRTGDDLGRYHLQHLLGITLFGLHGSFILVRSDVEREVGFDFGPEGSVTEDAWWALAEMENGSRSRWVDGYCREQSTRSVRDFLRQRRRWFIGLLLVCRYTPVKARWRTALLLSVATWSVAWMGSIIALFGLFIGVRVPAAVFVIGSISVCTYLALYALGLELALTQRGVRPLRRLRWHLLQVVLSPLFSLMESAAIVYALVRPELGFHVVEK